MQVNGVQFIISDGPDKYTVWFDNHPQKGKKWTVDVTCNGVESAQKTYYTNATPCPRVARSFANQYSKDFK